MSKKTLNRWYTAIIYKEDTNASEYIKKINALYNYVTYIEHARDVNEEGTPKKAHYHYLFYIGENARHVNTISKEIGIPNNYIERLQQKKYVTLFNTR